MTPRPLKPQHTAEGFSLLEMLAVIVILGLGLAITSSALKSHQSPSLSAVGEDILALLSKARLKAVFQATTISVDIDLRTKSFKLSGNDDALVLPETFEMIVTVGQETVRTGAVGAIIFSPDSTSTGGEIILKDESGRRLRLVTNWLTGLSRRQVKDD